MGELSPWHWAIVIVIFVVLFGAKRLPDAARSLGRSARILKAELNGDAPKPAEQVVTSSPEAATPTTAPGTAGVDPVVPPAPVQEQAVQEHAAPEQPQTAQH